MYRMLTLTAVVWCMTSMTLPTVAHSFNAGDYDKAKIDKGAVCKSNTDCKANEFCAKLTGYCELLGRCRPRPDVCYYVYDPVCGCNKQTYSNACVAAASGVSVRHPFACILEPQ